MTRAELEQALSAEGARIISSDQKAIHASLANGKEATVIFGSNGRTKKIAVDATDPNDSLRPFAQAG